MLLNSYPQMAVPGSPSAASAWPSTPPTSTLATP